MTFRQIKFSVRGRASLSDCRERNLLVALSSKQIIIFLLSYFLSVDQFRITGFTVVDQGGTKRSVDHSYHYWQCALSLHLRSTGSASQEFSDLFSYRSEPRRCPLPWGG